MNELEKAKKIFGDFENEEALKKAYRRLVKLYSENAEDQEKFKEVNIAKNTAIKYLKRFENNERRLKNLYNKKSVDIQEEQDYLEEYRQKLNAIQEVIKSLKKSSTAYRRFKKIPTVIIALTFIASIIVLFFRGDLIFGFSIMYAIFFSCSIKAAKQKEKLSSFIKQRNILRKEIEQIEKKLQGMQIELSAVEIAIDLSSNKNKKPKKQKMLIQKTA